MIVCNQTAHFLLIEIYHMVLKGRFAGRVNGALVSVEQFGLLFGIVITDRDPRNAKRNQMRQ
jgi:hypothetical protein